MLLYLSLFALNKYLILWTVTITHNSRQHYGNCSSRCGCCSLLMTHITHAASTLFNWIWLKTEQMLCIIMHNNSFCAAAAPSILWAVADTEKVKQHFSSQLKNSTEDLDFSHSDTFIFKTHLIPDQQFMLTQICICVYLLFKKTSKAFEDWILSVWWRASCNPSSFQHRSGASQVRHPNLSF